jgi:hypothetical protein
MGDEGHSGVGVWVAFRQDPKGGSTVSPGGGGGGSLLEIPRDPALMATEMFRRDRRAEMHGSWEYNKKTCFSRVYNAPRAIYGEVII